MIGWVVSVFLLLSAAPSCLAQLACCPTVYIYNPILSPIPVSEVDQIDQSCIDNRAGLTEFQKPASDGWVIQANWTETDAARFLYDFSNNPDGSYFQLLNGVVPTEQRVLTFYSNLDFYTTFPGFDFFLSSRSTAVCNEQLLDSTPVLQAILQVGFIVGVVDQSVYADWVTNLPPGLNYQVVSRGAGDYNEDVLSGLQTISSSFNNCVVCEISTTTTPNPTTPPAPTTTTTSMATTATSMATTATSMETTATSMETTATSMETTATHAGFTVPVRSGAWRTAHSLTFAVAGAIMVAALV